MRKLLLISIAILSVLGCQKDPLPIRETNQLLVSQSKQRLSILAKEGTYTVPWYSLPSSEYIPPPDYSTTSTGGSPTPTGSSPTPTNSYWDNFFMPDYIDDPLNYFVQVQNVRIPQVIILDNKQVVKIYFGVTKSDGLSADQPVNPKILNALILALNIASKTVTITSISIKSTTNGFHTNVNSNHFKALALDISMINDIYIVSGSPTIQSHIRKLQESFDQVPGIRENIGPYLRHKFAVDKPDLPVHNDHIHISVNSY